MEKHREVIYQAANENWRFLAKWRQLALAGQLAVLAGALSFTNAAFDHSFSPSVLAACFIFMALISVVLWIVDRRTHRLTMDACRAGTALEGAEKGFFRVNQERDSAEGVDHRHWYRDSHSVAAAILCLGSTFIFIFLAISVELGFFSQATSTKKLWDYRVLHVPLVAPPSSTSAPLEEQLSRASEDGWELLAAGTDSTNGPFLILRRHKK